MTTRTTSTGRVLAAVTDATDGRPAVDPAWAPALAPPAPVPATTEARSPCRDHGR
jgi:hypothetical protein